MTVKIDGTNGIDTAQLRAPDGDPVAMTIDALGSVAFPQMVQTWQNLTASRTIGTTYTNDTGQQIQACVSAESSTVGANIVATVGGVTLRGSSVGSANSRASITFNVPAGATYSVGFSPAANPLWTELR